MLNLTPDNRGPAEYEGTFCERASLYNDPTPIPTAFAASRASTNLSSLICVPLVFTPHHAACCT